MTEYLVVIEGEGESFSAYSPDLPGCVAAGESLDEVEALMKDAIRLHIESLRAHKEPVPSPRATARFVAAG
ncbi:MAG: type II toxin-antitoxin system HicB family antitoxin [Actinobacteria bacterium]|nr:type II toxin-antitoxin system HicB family antitoxin [Actinomycetota bacterium]